MSFGYWKRSSFVLLLTATMVFAMRAASGQAAGQVQPGQTASVPAHAGEEQQAEVKQEAENDAYRHSPMVKKLGGKLGMNVEQSATAFEWANFLLLAVGIGWVVVKKLPAHLRSRDTAIQKHLVDARTATEEASTRLNGVEQRLGLLDEQIAAMRSQAAKASTLDEQKIKASLEDEKQKVLVAAEQEIAAATAQAQRQIQQYAAELAIEQAARKLVVTAETDRLLVQDFARRLVGDDSKGGQN